MTKFIQDVLTALKSMWALTRNAAIGASKVIGIIVAVIGIFCALGYLLVHWPMQTITVIAMAMLAGWFLIELETARKIREYDESWERFHDEKRKPAHGGSND